MRIRWRGLELPSLVTAERSTLSATYGKFIAEPFERGFGVTVGNSLRRILLSSLEGSAVTQIKLHGAQHEFTHPAGRDRRRDRHRVERQVAGGEELQRADPRRADREEPERPGDRRRRPHRRAGRGDQQGPPDRHLDRGRAVSAGDGGGERPGIRAGHRAHAPGPGDRHHPRRRRLQPGDPRPLRGRGDPRGPEDQLRQADHGNLDQRLGLAGNGPGRVGQDPPQTPQPVRSIQRTGPDGAQRSPRRRARSPSTRRRRPSWP